MSTSALLRSLRLLLVALAAALVLAPSAGAVTSSWVSLPGLLSNPLDDVDDADWVRVYEHGPGASIYAGTEDDGIHFSANGVNFTPRSGGLSAEGRHVRDILYANGKVIAGTQAGLYLLSGANWAPLAQGSAATDLPRSVQALLSTSGSTVLAGTFAGGVYRSTDGGETWTKPAPGNGMPAGETVWGLDKIGAITFASTSSGIYRSANGGASWTASNDGIPPSATTLRIIADGFNPNILYVATGGDGLYRSINFGETWASISDGLGNGVVRGLSQEAVSLKTKLYAATGNGLWVGTTGNGPVPGPVVWQKVTTTGLGSNTVLWAMDRLPLSTLLLAGTQSNGGYALSLQPPAIQGGAPPTVTAPSLEVGTTLTANPGTWDGTGGFLFAYVWWRCSSAQTDTTAAAVCSKIPGATGSTYTLTDGEKNYHVGVEVHATNAFPSFTDYKAPSATAGKVVANPDTLPGSASLGAASIAMKAPGNLSLPNVGDTLLAVEGVTLPKPAGTVVSYQWLRCDEAGTTCVDIPGATGSSYVIRSEDSALRLAVRKRVATADGAAYASPSGTTNLVIPEPAANLTAPKILGTPEVGETVVGNVGTWKSEKTTYERQWLQCDAEGNACEPIFGASGPGFVVREQDRGHRLRLRVRADVNESYKLPLAVEVISDASSVVPVLAGPGGPADPGPVDPGPGGPGPVPGDKSAPVVSGLKVAASKKASTQLAFTSSEAGTVTVLVERPSTGRKVGKACKKATKQLRRNKKCTLYAKVAQATAKVAAGKNTLTLGKKVGGKTIKRGTYRVTVTVRDAAGNATKKTLTLKRK